MQTVIFGALGTLGVAAIIGIVGLAFKDSEAYGRLAKVLLAALGTILVGYMGYAWGSIDGGKSAVEQILSGVAIDTVKTEMPAWPLGAMSVVFTVLVTLMWFPEYLGIKGKQDGDKKLN